MEDNVLHIDPEALEMIVQLRDQEPGDEEYALSVGVAGITGLQFSYDLAFVPVSDRSESQHLERHGDLALIIPQADVDKLRGAALELTPQGLSMNNPNTPASPPMAAPKGDLSGPLADQVQQVLSEQVNPAIASHGGAAELVSVDSDTAYLRLMGGCQGCGMAQVTLKQGIERILLDSIPELAAVVDVTDHASGEDPYFESAKK
ncbi:MAG TPA: NifU family protein [Acidimicrobiia bacterium]|nr:NifU family protein [Acidimicrobiia bacterium]